LSHRIIIEAIGSLPLANAMVQSMNQCSDDGSMRTELVAIMQHVGAPTIKHLVPGMVRRV
jgi:hypothetical protein